MKELRLMFLSQLKLIVNLLALEWHVKGLAEKERQTCGNPQLNNTGGIGGNTRQYCGNQQTMGTQYY